MSQLRSFSRPHPVSSYRWRSSVPQRFSRKTHRRPELALPPAPVQRPSLIIRPRLPSTSLLSTKPRTPAPTSTNTTAAASPPATRSPADQPDVDQFYLLYNVNTQSLNGILTKFSDPANQKNPNEQKIGDYYAACMNTDLINQKGVATIQPLFDQIDKVSKHGLAYLGGELQRQGVDVFFGFGEMQDFKDSTKQIAVADQGGIGLPERDYYTRTGEKDVKLRQQYVDHIAKMLTFAGETPDQAATDAKNILAFETALAKASLTVTDQRDPQKIYHPTSLADFEKNDLNGVPFAEFLKAMHSPEITSLNNASPTFFTAMVQAVTAAYMLTLRAYLKYHTMTTFASAASQQHR